MDSGYFQTSRLVKELKSVYKELNSSFSDEICYSYIINYILKKIGEDCNADLQYMLPDINPGAAEKTLCKIMESGRYNFKAAAEKNLLGEIYEGFLDSGIRKKLGLYYTPKGVVEFIMDNTVKNADIVENPNIKVLDPSCGSGYFLLKAYDVLKEKLAEKLNILQRTYKNKNYIVSCRGRVLELKGREYWTKEFLHYHIIANCIYGADIDESGVTLTKNCLRLKEYGEWCPEPNIALCDSLVKWEYSKGPMMEFWNKKFDFIIGNPPWVSLSRKQGVKITKEKIDYYKANYKGSTYLPNLYEYFLERSLELAADKGAVGFLLPDRFAWNQQYGSLRKHILENFSIRNINTDIKLEHIIADSMAIIIENSFQLDNIVKISNSQGELNILQKELLNQPDYHFYSVPVESSEMYRDINDGTRLLKEVAHTFTGFIGVNKNISDVEGKEMVPVLKGANIEKYRIKGFKYYDLVPEKIIGGTKNMHKLLYPNKILVRKTGNSLIAAMDKTGTAIEQSLYGIIVTSEGILPEYILAVINSSLMQWYYINFLVTNLNSTPQLKKIHLDRIPIKSCSLEKQLYIKNLVDELENSSEEENENIKKEIEKEIYGIYKIKKVPHGRHVERI